MSRNVFIVIVLALILLMLLLLCVYLDNVTLDIPENARDDAPAPSTTIPEEETDPSMATSDIPDTSDAAETEYTDPPKATVPVTSEPAGSSEPPLPTDDAPVQAGDHETGEDEL